MGGGGLGLTPSLNYTLALNICYYIWDWDFEDENVIFYTT